MPTTYTDQFFNMDPANPPGFGTSLSFSHYDLIDQNNDNDFDRFDNDSINGSDITSSYPGDTVTINVPGIGHVTYTGITFYLADGSQVFTPNDGQALQDGTFVSSTWVSPQGPLLVSELGPTCFARGTLIKTAKGRQKIETLAPGDQLYTRDNGFQTLRWIGHQHLQATGVNAPVRIQKGALGNCHDLWVSQQHRMLITGWQAELYMGQTEALVAAKHLVNNRTIRIIESRAVEYFHLLLDNHEILTAAGIPSESFHPAHAFGPEEHAAAAEVIRLFPEMAPIRAMSAPAARQVARSYEGCLMAA